MAKNNKFLNIKFTKDQLHQLSEVLLMPLPKTHFMSMKAGTYNHAELMLFTDLSPIGHQCVCHAIFSGHQTPITFQKRLEEFKNIVNALEVNHD